MNSNIISTGILKAVAIITSIILLLFFLFKIQSVITYITIAAVVSLIGRPIVIFLEQKAKLKIATAAIVTIVILLTFIIGLISLFIPLIVEQSEKLSLLDIDQFQMNIQNIYFEFVQYFKLHHINIEDSIEKSKILSFIDYSFIPNFLNSLISGLGSFSVGLASVLFISFFFLKDSFLFENTVLTLIPHNKESKLKNSLEKIKNLLSRYFIGLVLQIIILNIIYSIGLLIIGVENALVIAFLCALMNIIPYVGPLIGGFIMILLTMISNLDASFIEVILPKSFWVFILLIIGQLIDNFISVPYIFSKSVKSHPLEIFLVILIAGVLFGIIGLVIAVPVYTAIKVVLKEFLSENKIVKKLTKDL